MPTQNITNGWEYSFTASNTASIPVINIPSSINNILIIFTNVSVASGAPFMLVRLSTNNGSSYISSGYQSGHNYFGYNTSVANNQNNSTGLQMGFQIGTGPFSSGTLYLYNLNTSTFVVSTGTTFWTAATLFGITGGQLSGTTGVNAFQIVLDSGNIATGTFKIYGLN